jgi:hypothetical protein
VFVVIVIKVQTLTDEVQAMKVVHALNVDNEAATMFGADLNVSISEAAGNAILIRDNTRSIYRLLVSVIEI